MDKCKYDKLYGHIINAISHKMDAEATSTYQNICQNKLLMSIAESLIVIAEVALQKEKERMIE